MRAALPSLLDSSHIRAMAKPPPKKPKDPARPTRAKASRPDASATPDALADLLNPAIKKGTAGLGPSTGANPNLAPPPDNSWDRRRDFSAAHTARKSSRGFEEAPQRDYAASPITGLDPELARELGLDADDDASSSPSPGGGGSSAGGGRGGVTSITALSSSAARAEISGATALKTEPEAKLSPAEKLEQRFDARANAKAVVAERRAEAKAKGYEGEMCGECANFTLVRNGTCLKCDTCGSTTGCS